MKAARVEVADHSIEEPCTSDEHLERSRRLTSPSQVLNDNRSVVIWLTAIVVSRPGTGRGPWSCKSRRSHSLRWVARNKGIAQDWRPVWEQERRLLVSLLQELRRASLRHPKRIPLKNPERVPVRVPLRQQDRRLFRHENRARVRTHVQRRKRALLRCDEREQARGADMRLQRWLLQQQARLLFLVLLRQLLQMEEQGPL